VIERDDDEESIHNTNDKNNNNTSGKGVVFLLWGKPASVKAQTVLASYSKKDSKHAIIMSSHLSPLGATKTSSPFLGSKCFSRANEELVKRGWDPVDWRVDGGL
jgi:uracil-DNA glycosylase